MERVINACRYETEAQAVINIANRKRLNSRKIVELALEADAKLPAPIKKSLLITVIQGIRDAKYTIWVAVAWLSNEVIINELIAKRRQGVNVRMIISKEESNTKYYRQLATNFDLMLIPHSGWNDWNRMHDKFCIIDFEYVMHGSYNWTKTANFNDETLATALDRDFVKKFADEFIRLYRKGRAYEPARD